MIKKLLMALVLMPMMGLAASYTVSNTEANLGTISFPATISGTLLNILSTTDGYTETITFKPSVSGTYRISTTPTLDFGEVHTIKTTIYQGTINELSSWNGNGSATITFSSGNYYTIKLQMMSPSYYTTTRYSYVATIGESAPTTYTVTYKPGAYGSGSQQTSTKTKGTALTLKGAIFTRTGYTQTGWSTTDGGSKTYNLNGSYTTDASITLYPYWTANASTTYTVTYKPGAYGSGSQQTSTKTKGTALTLKGAIFTRTGYTQTGWSTTDGGSKAYALNGSYTTDASIILYPYWTVVAKSDLLPYTPSGWSGPLVISTSSSSTTSDSSFKDTDTIYICFAVKCENKDINSSFKTALYIDGSLYTTFSSSSLAMDHYTYKTGYSIGTLTSGSHIIKIVADYDGSIAESDENNNTYSKTITINAVISKCTVSFNAGGGTGAKTSESITSGTYYTLPSCPFTRMDYVFAGWNVTSCCTAYRNPMSEGDRIYVEEDILLTATWTYSPTIRPSNDNFANATLISGSSVTASGSNLNATSEGGEPILSYKSSATTTVWWKWVAPGNGSVQIDTVDSAFDTVLGVYRGSSVSSLTKAGADSEDDDGGGSGNTSKCTFDCISGTTYYICVAGYNGKSGNILLHVVFTQPVTKTYTIYYEPGDGGIGEIVFDEFDPSTGVVLKDAIFTHENGYRQVAWCTRENYNAPYKTGDGRSAPQVYEFGERIYPTTDLVLYPSWYMIIDLVVYEPGLYGVGVRQTESGLVGSLFRLKGAIFTRAGYVQTGWSKVDGGAKVYDLDVQYATEVTETLYPYWTPESQSVSTYGPWGEAESVKNPDKLGPTMLTDVTLELNGAAGAVGDVVAVFRGDTGALCGLGKVMDDSGTLSMVCYAPTGVKLHFKVWVAASGLEEPIVVDCDKKSDLTAPTSGAFLSGHSIVVSDDKNLTISLGSADWHTVSFNVLPEDPSPAEVFGSVKTKIAAVTQGIEFWMPGKSSSLKAIEIGKGYWVNTKIDNVEWTISGKTDPKATITLEEGWNLVGYAPESEGAVQTVLKTALAEKAIDYVTYGVEFYPGGMLTKMEPGKAYWVHAKKAWTFVYDEPREALKAMSLFGNGQEVPTYGPWGESEAVKNPDKLGPTFLTNMMVEIDGEPAMYGDVVAVFRGDTGALCGLGKVMDDSGTLTAVCYAPKGVTLSFKIWLAESGVEEAVVVRCDNASKLIAPESGAFYEGHEISGTTAEIIETIVPGEKVEIDTGFGSGYTASGLPSGLKYNRTTGIITGAATKPTAAEGTVVKFTKSGVEPEELTIIVTAIPKVTVVMEGVNSPSDTDNCKVTGAGAFLVDRTVTLKATAPKGVVFMGWYDGGSVVATQATYTFTMGKKDIELVAKFKKEVMSVGCKGLSDKEYFPAGVTGAEGGIALDISTESGVKSIKVDKLPTGMKYDSKIGRIIGAPTKAGDNTVVITVTAVSGAVEKKEIKVAVEAMPVMAVGKFDGFVLAGKDNAGTFTMTTTDAGKLTAKIITAAGTISFSGTCWDTVKDGVYRATLTTKSGEKLALVLDSTAAWDANQLSGSFTTAAKAETAKTAAVPSRSYSLVAQRNAFSKTWYFAAEGNEAMGWTFAYAKDSKTAAFTVTMKADGATVIAGKLPNGIDESGRDVFIKVSASGYANVGGLKEGVILADFAPVMTVNKVKKVLAIKTNLWFDCSDGEVMKYIGSAKFVE